MKRKTALLTAAVMLVSSLSACALPGGSGAVPEAPVLSHAAGSYDEAFTLTVTAEKGVTVRYTTDGSLPTAESPEFPEDGLLIDNRTDEPNVLSAVDPKTITEDEHMPPPNVDKGTVIRAAAFKRDGTCGEAVTATYLVGLDYDKIKVVSLVLDSDSLFSYEEGIYIKGKAYDDWIADDYMNKYAETWELEGNFSQKGRDWERDVCVQVIEKDGTLGIEQDMGIRVMGAASRTYFQKSFRLTAREEYGSKHFDYPLIDGLVTDSGAEPLERYKSFVLRNGGNDNCYCLIRDAFIQERVSDRSFATQDTQPAVVFINGEYWGLYTITEDYSDNYIQYNYGVDNKNVVMIKRGELEEGAEEDIELYNQLLADIEATDLSAAEGLEWLESRMDVQGLIDYLALSIYIHNDDGPFKDNNWRIWRARDTDPTNEFADGRWRFMLYDTEYSLGLYEDGRNYEADSLRAALESEWMWGKLFSRLMENEQFRARFVNTFMDLRNTAFEPDAAWDTFAAMGGGYLPYAPANYERNAPVWVREWSDTNGRFLDEMGKVKYFVDRRYKFAGSMLETNLGLNPAVTVTLLPGSGEGGTVTVNTASYDPADGISRAEYYTEFPVTVTAVPDEGWVFAGWEGDAAGCEQSFVLELTDDFTMTALFEKA